VATDERTQLPSDETLIVALIAAIVTGGLLGTAAIAAINNSQTVALDELDSL